MDKPIVSIIDCQTGETVTREFSEQELSEFYATTIQQSEDACLIYESPEP